MDVRVLPAGVEGVTFTVLSAGSSELGSEPVLVIQSAAFAQAMLELYLGRKPLLPAARSIWIESAVQLLGVA